VVIGFSVTGCPPDDGGGDSGGSNNNGGNTAVIFNSVTANGSSSQTTTQLILTFNQEINGLSASDISLSGVSNVTKGSLSASGSTYTLGISGFTSGGTLNVAVSKSGHTISDSPKTVTIYYNSDGGNPGGNTVTFNSVTQNGSSSQTTSQLTLTFSETITGLSASDITLSGVSNVTKGSLSGSGPSYNLGISGLSSGGTLNVAVAKSGYTISGSPKTVTIYHRKLSAPTNVDAARPGSSTLVNTSTTSIKITWNTVPGAVKYKVYEYKATLGGEYIWEGDVTGTEWTHTGLQPNTTHIYAVAAVDSGGVESDKSSTVTGRTAY
jgi:hypothetical protein